MPEMQHSLAVSPALLYREPALYSLDLRDYETGQDATFRSCLDDMVHHTAPTYMRCIRCAATSGAAGVEASAVAGSPGASSMLCRMPEVYGLCVE